MLIVEVNNDVDHNVVGYNSNDTNADAGVDLEADANGDDGNDGDDGDDDDDVNLSIITNASSNDNVDADDGTDDDDV